VVIVDVLALQPYRMRIMWASVNHPIVKVCVLCYRPVLMDDQVNAKMATGQDSDRALPARSNRFVDDDFGGFYPPLGLEPMTLPVQIVDKLNIPDIDELAIDY